MTRTASHQDNNKALISLGILLMVAVAFGGGGVRYGLANLAVQLAALTVVGLNRPMFVKFLTEAPWALKCLILASLLLPLLHSVPLPPQLWNNLPGRDAVVASFASVDASDNWTSLSVDPARSWVALSGLIVPLTILALGWSLAYDRLVYSGWIIVLLGVSNVLVGVPQVLSNGASGILYPESPMPGVLFGTFANRNSTGIFLVSALSCAALLRSPVKHNYAGVIRVLICILLLVGISLTRSRSALALAVLPVAIGLLRAWMTYRSQHRRSTGARSLRLVFCSVIGIATALLTLVAVQDTENSGRLDHTFSRFQASSDARFYIWEDSAFSAQHYWPVGSGMGTFDEIFQLHESLENVTQRRAGRAHNDYLEVAIEAGLPGLTIIVGWLVLCGLLLNRLKRAEDVWSGLAGGVTLTIIMLQSAVDYPLRNQAMLATSSLAFLILFGANLRPKTGHRIATLS